MIRPLPHVCMVCLVPVRALLSLFVNGLGWIDVCDHCAVDAEQAT